MAEKREKKGLCFNCDQQYSKNHRCLACFSLLVVEDDELGEDVSIGLLPSNLVPSDLNPSVGDPRGLDFTHKA